MYRRQHAPRCFFHAHPIHCQHRGYDWIGGRRRPFWVCPKCARRYVA